MGLQKRRMRQLEHAREVQRMVDDRRRLYQEQKAREEADIAAQSAEEVRWCPLGGRSVAHGVHWEVGRCAQDTKAGLGCLFCCCRKRALND